MADGLAGSATRAAAVRPIPRAGIGLSTLGLGGGSLGGLYDTVAEETAHGAVAAAMEADIRYFDTAPMYGHGLGERRLGEALGNFERDSYVLGTKVGFTIEPFVDEGEDFETKYADPLALDGRHDFGFDACLRGFGASLERLGTDRVDIAYVHDPDEAEVLLDPEQRTGAMHFDAVLAGAYRALSRLRDEGVVRAIGIGMFGIAGLARFARAADLDVLLLAGGYTLLQHGDAIETLFPVLEERDIALVVGAVFQSGILATGTGVARPTYNYRPADADVLARVRRIEAHCSAFGVSLGAAALQFPLGSRHVASVIPGARSRAEVEQNVRYVSEEIPTEFWAALRAGGLIHPLAPVGESATAGPAGGIASTNHGARGTP